MCPAFPVIGPKNTSGVLRWGCESGCRYGLDGFTMKNISSKTPGIMAGTDDSWAKGFERISATKIFAFLICFY
jgi:hypothetical protein